MDGARSRRNTLSVTFVGDDDVVQHISDLHGKTSGRQLRSRRASHPVRSSLKKIPEEALEASDEDEHGEVVKRTCTVLEGGDGLALGSEVFSFKTPKKSGQMAQKAYEARTPKSISGTPNQNSAEDTQSKGGKRTSSEGKPPRLKQLRKIEATTPSRLRQRNKEVYREESETDDSLESSDDSSEGEMETPKRDSKPASTLPTPAADTPTAVRRTRRKMEQVEVPTMVEDYFDLHASGPGPTSDRTLSKLDMPRMDQESLNTVLQDTPTSHRGECSHLYMEHKQLFNKWMCHMCSGFSILLYGLGSKRGLMEDFRNNILKDFSHVVVNGYFPSLTIKHILHTITEDILEHEGSFRNPLDQLRFIKEQYDIGEYKDFYLIVHNIDGVMLRGEKTQSILSLLSQIRGFHVLASIDHINAPLIWDQTKCSRFNWLWFDVTTYVPYTAETSYENSLLVQQSGALAMSSLTHVMKSLTTNAKGIFQLLARHQLESKDDVTYVGMSFQDLYQRCREQFLVNSDLTLKAQLIEFRDHKIIKSKISYEGVELLFIPIDPVTLAEFLEQEEDNS